MSTNKQDAPASNLRRSSRSTRGSIKPVVDLTKIELSDQEEPASKEEEEEVVDLGEEDEDEEYQQETKTKRTTRVKKQSVTSGEAKKTAKTTRRAPKKVLLNDEITKGSSKIEKSEIIDDDENIDSDGDLDEVHYELSVKEMKEINKAFDVNCSDGAELLSSNDLKTAIRSLGFEPRADEVKKLSKKFGNKSGKVTRQGFHKIMAFKIGSSPSVKDNHQNDEISKVFNLLDLDKKGMITLNNLKSISQELNEEITDEELTEMINEADLDGDSMINKEEFFHIMKKTNLY